MNEDLKERILYAKGEVLTSFNRMQNHLQNHGMTYDQAVERSGFDKAVEKELALIIEFIEDYLRRAK